MATENEIGAALARAFTTPGFYDADQGTWWVKGSWPEEVAENKAKLLAAIREKQ